MSEFDTNIPTAFGECLISQIRLFMVFKNHLRLISDMQQFLVKKFSIGCWCGMIIWLDPFAEANAEDSGAGTKEYVHVRVQQRNGRKSLTTVQGLKKEFSYSKILKDLKKEFCCNGTVVEDPELGQVCLLFFIFKINVLCNH
jgi:translation initiation factor SUI1